VGATIGVATSHQSGGSGLAKFTHERFVFSIGAKAAYHFDWKIRGLDTYAALTLGADVTSASSDYNEVYFANSAIKPSADSATSFLFGLEIGARFFFNDNFGVFMEEGFNTFTYLRSGFVYKFKF
jgi:outer membrane scaffolding protein for murein synthesis (MipA/OmpV family)